MTKLVTKTQGGISFTRLTCAFLTCGITLPFLGVRRRYKSVTVAK